MFFFEQEADFVQDREDLINILQMRFGKVPGSMIDSIYKINELDTLERLILVASNAPDFSIFKEEMEAGSGSFKILGERFNPLSTMEKGDN